MEKYLDLNTELGNIKTKTLIPWDRTCVQTSAYIWEDAEEKEKMRSQMWYEKEEGSFYWFWERTISFLFQLGENFHTFMSNTTEHTGQTLQAKFLRNFTDLLIIIQETSLRFNSTCPMNTSHTLDLLDANKMNMLYTEWKCWPNQRTWVFWFPINQVIKISWTPLLIWINPVFLCSLTINYIAYIPVFSTCLAVQHYLMSHQVKWHLIAAQCCDLSCHIEHNVWLHMPYH